MTTLNSPKVSVCMPVYNGSKYVAEAIESVLLQTYKDFKLIVIDNCSTDNTEEIVRSFKDPKLEYMRNEKNVGLTGNLNRCLEMAEGEYVYIMHHDDIMLPQNLELKVQLLDEHPEVGFVHSNLVTIDPQGLVMDENIWCEDSRRDYVEDGLSVFHRYVDYLPLGASLFIGSVLARRTCYENLDGFHSELPNCHDSEMYMRMMLFYNVACIGKPLVKYRVHPDSATSSWGHYESLPYLKQHYRALTIVFSKCKDRIPEANKLKQDASLSFGQRALNLAITAIFNGNSSDGKGFLKEAVRFSPSIIRNSLFWKGAVGLLIGPKGIALYQRSKNRGIK